MKRVLVLVEGQTEERFVKDVLSPYLLSSNIVLIPTIVETKKVLGGESHKGGGDFSKIKADVLSLLNDTNAVAVTTLFDFYGFPKIPNVDVVAYQNIAPLEQAIEAQFNHQRFKAYLQKHEFEAFLFIEPELTAKAALKQQQADLIKEHRNQFNHVEEINLGKDTAPSKRLMVAIGRYNKPRIGAKVTQELGIARLMQECPKFADWVNWMLSFALESE